MNVRPFTEDDVTGADILMFLQYGKEAWAWEEDGRFAASATLGVHGGAEPNTVSRALEESAAPVVPDGLVADGMHVDTCSVVFEKELE